MKDKPLHFSFKGALLMLVGFVCINWLGLFFVSHMSFPSTWTSVVVNGVFCSLWVSFVISRVELKEPFDKQALLRAIKIGIVFTLVAYLWARGIYL